jgi:hypothetical protein
LEYTGLAEQYQNFSLANTFGQVPALALAIQSQTPHELGRTYAAAATMFLPRDIAPWKLPDVGEIVTRQELPHLWYEANTGVQVGAAGEAWVNFGIPGVVVGGFIFGLGLRGLRRMETAKAPLTVLLAAVAFPRVALYFRGGFANVTTTLLIEVAIIVAAVVLAQGRRPRRQRKVVRSEPTRVDQT